MQPSGGSSPLPASPLPPSPYQQTYSPESGLTFAPATATAPSPSQPQPRKRIPKPAIVVIVIVVLMAVLVFSGALDSFLGSSGSGSGSNAPNVKVTNTSASHRCPAGGTATETFLFTLVNGGPTNAAATIGFFLNDAQVMSGTYSAPAAASTPYSVTANLASCPPSGSTYYLDLVSVTAA